MSLGGSTPATPAVPDYTAAANQQAQLGTTLNRFNQNTPYGSSTWSSDPATNKWTLDQTLSPEQQQILSNEQQYGITAGGKANDALSNVNLSGIDQSQLPQMPQNAGTTTQDAIMSRLQPQINDQNSAFDQRMANQGLAPGTEAYDKARRDLGQQQNDLQINAGLQGINTDMTARNQAIQNQIAMSNLPIQQLNAFRSGTSLQTPNFTNSGAAVTPNLTGAAQAQYQGAANNYNGQVAQNNATSSGLWGLGAAIAPSVPLGSVGSSIGRLFGFGG